jgi:proteic killer suppression protein
VDLVFASKTLRHLCESHSRARRFLGERAAEKLRNRLADLEAASNVTEVIAGRPRAPSVAPRDQLSLDLAHGYVLVFGAADNRRLTPDTIAVDWRKVTRIKILKIEKI